MALLTISASFGYHMDSLMQVFSRFYLSNMLNIISDNVSTNNLAVGSANTECKLTTLDFPGFSYTFLYISYKKPHGQGRDQTIIFLAEFFLQ